ncbi:MAG: sulfurtransferase [Phycisphaeraceae bacterium]|nr:sulfurtransferase [Phycisphaeraceae bacterium]
MTLSLISPTEFNLLSQNQKTVLLDVRTPVEYAQVHAQKAVLEPLDQLDPQKAASRHGFSKQDAVYVICKSGGRAKTAGQKFIDAGFEKVISVEGGTDAWVAANLPVVRSASRTLPLQQQVFIVVSIMILSGVLLGHFVHPAWLLLAGFAGCGLLFAGLTGYCGMAMMLAKMPWNQVKFKDQTVTSCSIDSSKRSKSCGCGS